MLFESALGKSFRAGGGPFSKVLIISDTRVSEIVEKLFIFFYKALDGLMEIHFAPVKRKKMATKT